MSQEEHLGEPKQIIIRGAREHNLKDVDVELPRDKLVVITGLSGSGKSSLAFDTLYAEGQRRYVESLSAYARQFLGEMQKPDVDQIEGLSPAISIDQKGASRNPRSTVGTVTEIYDYLRLLYARVGVPHCPRCGREVNQQTVGQIVEAIEELPEGSRILLMAPLIKDRKGEHRKVFEDVRKMGFVRVRVNGEVRDVDEEIELDRYKMHTIEAVVDRLVVRHADGNGDSDNPGRGGMDRTRLADSVETALRLGGGVMMVTDVTNETSRDHLFSEHFACMHCGLSLPEIEPRTFSFNSPHGACPACTGLGTELEIDPDLVIPDRGKSLKDGAVEPWTRQRSGDSYYWQLLEAAAKEQGIPLDVPVRELSPSQSNYILYGGRRGEQVTLQYQTAQGKRRTYTTHYEGVIPNLQRRHREASSDYAKQEIERYMAERPCPVCKGRRLKPEALAVTVAEKSIDVVTDMSVTEMLAWVEELREEGVEEERLLTRRQQMIARQILKELDDRLSFMANVGLDYLTIDRQASTLSGGEAQRIRLATQIGSRLMGVLYILDEPSIGLHPRDNGRLIRTLKGMRDLGNTVIVVEHDEETMRSADWILDLGPGAGEHGGEVVCSAPSAEFLSCRDSLTAAYLRGERRIPMPEERRPGDGSFLAVVGAAENNLKEITARFPLRRFIAVTGVSGSGKSSLVVEVLYKRLNQYFYRAKAKPGKHEMIEGLEFVDKVVNIDQSPIGRTPRSNPATYTNVFTDVRNLFARLPESKARGYKPGRFSFNVKGGRCEACRGDGIIKIEMQFLPDVYVPCEVCHGKRYNREALEIRYKARNIADVLDMTVDEALEFFSNVPRIRTKLQTLSDVGLGYIRLGQPATTLSGGEAQRIKLSKELSRRSTGRTFYILDEPTTGLHFADIEKLLQVLHRLTDQGNTVVVIEHNLDVIKAADWLIDLGPEGGEGGGWIIAEGTPEQVSRMRRSYTGQFLARLFEERELSPAPVRA
ncbi:MAG: excinuclease ABC subunit UvrA [Anaerolineae bacterium]|nr:excinuclease ABC subunit UvrA [Anaerolineae bacterium]